MTAEPRRRGATPALLGGLAVVLAAVALRAVGGRPVAVQSADMQPALRPGDVVWVDRSAPEAGDVVAWRPSKGDLHLARVVAGPGAEVEIAAGRVWVDGVATGPPTDPRAAPVAPTRVGAGEVFLLGDDPVVASDSRQWGPVERARVEGVARRILWSAAPHDGAPDWERVGERIR